MARRYNELYIGDEFLTEEGRDIKHQGLIREFGNINFNKLSDTSMDIIGIDLETNSKTADLKLLGTWDGEKYTKYFGVNFLATLFNIVDKAFWSKNNTAIAYWNKLDPFVLYKQFLLLFDKEKQYKSMKRYSKISGEWNRKTGKWKTKPVIEVTVTRGKRRYKFGIKNVIRSSIQFYYYELIGNGPKQFNNGMYPINTVWAYDIAPLYKYGLEKEMLDRSNLFPYYSKVSKDAHIVDWERYVTDKDYRENIVDRSNMYDARAVYDLAHFVLNSFKKAFRHYPRNLISAGSIARASIVATLINKYEDMALLPKDVEKAVKEDMASIPIMNFYDYWSHQLDEESLKDLFCLFWEAYSGGNIEAYRYGLIKKGFYSDLAGAYIYHLSRLLDLRESTVTTGEGSDFPRTPDSYLIFRGDVNIPLGVQYSPLTVKDIDHKSTNVRAVGMYRASYTINERDYLTELGATFKNETWYNIQTKGELSPLSQVVIDLTKRRYELIAQKDSSEYLVKTSSASVYGITFEATNTFREDLHMEVFKNGYRGGEFLNPLYALWTTAETRIQTSRASMCIEANGGKPVMAMTDCVFWEGEESALDPSFINHVKTLGMFETPVGFTQMASLGTGRYSYVDAKKGKVTTKNRGLNVSELHSPDGVDITSHDWIEALKIAERNNSFKLRVKTRLLVSVGLVVHTNHVKSLDKNGKEIEIPIDVADLGRIMEVYREVDLITGLTKRILETPIKSIRDITQGSIGTKSKYYGIGMLGDKKIVDQTLPILRGEVMKHKVKTAKKRDLQNRSNASYKYANKVEVKEKILKSERDKYAYIRKHGFNRDIAKKWAKRSIERIENELIKGDTKWEK